MDIRGSSLVSKCQLLYVNTKDLILFVSFEDNHAPIAPIIAPTTSENAGTIEAVGLDVVIHMQWGQWFVNQI